MKKSIEKKIGRSAEYRALSLLARDMLLIATVEILSGRVTLHRVPAETEELLQDYILQGFYFDGIAYDYIGRRCAPEDVDRLRSEITIKRITESFRECDTIVLSGKRLNDRYIRIEITRADVNNFVIAIKDVDSEVRHDRNGIQQVQESYNKAVKEVSSKKRYIYDISHDIRTPLNAILGYSTVASDNYSDTKLLKKCLSKIEDAGQQVLGIINGIMDLNELEEGSIKISEGIVSMSDLERQVEESVRALVKDRKLDFSISNQDSINPALIMDNNHMVRALVNLITFSCKRTDAGGNIRLTLRPLASPTAGYRDYAFTVEDNSNGMDDEMLRTLRNFLKGKDVGEDDSEIDISFAIIRNILDHIGGSLEIDSSEKKGDVFTIRCEFKLGDDAMISETTEKDEMENKVEQNTVLSGKRVLVVDDSQFSLDIATTLLNGFNIQTECASDGLTAIDMIVENEVGYYDIVLMDIEMPNLDGLDTTRQIRGLHRPDAKTIPIVALTGVVFEDARKEANSAGMDGFITKPINASEMRNTLISVLQNN